MVAWDGVGQEIEKGYKSTEKHLEHGNVHYLDHGENFTGGYICRNLPNYTF